MEAKKYRIKEYRGTFTIQVFGTITKINIIGWPTRKKGYHNCDKNGKIWEWGGYLTLRDMSNHMNGFNTLKEAKEKLDEIKKENKAVLDAKTIYHY